MNTSLVSRDNQPSALKFILNHFDLLLSMALAILGIYIFYPGAMSGDSVGQWLQVLHPENISTWYPPSMVYLWILLDKVIPGPQGMLIFHYVIYHLSIYLLANIFCSKTSRKILYILIIGLFPPIFFLNGVIWKDISMLVALSMSFALLFQFELSKKLSSKVPLLFFSVVFMLYGVSVRHNAIVCLIPYIIYGLSIYIKIENWKKILAISVLTLTLFYGGVKLTHFVNTGFVKEGNIAYQMENSAFIWDLWGMSVELEKNIIPQYVFNKSGRSLTVNQLKKHYVPYTASILWTPYLNPTRWQKSFPDQKFKKDFIRLIIKYPAAYFKVRSRIVLYMLGIKKPVMLAYLFEIYKPTNEKDWLYTASKDIDFQNKEALNTAKKTAHYLLTKTPLYLAWVYFILILGQVICIFIYKKEIGKYFKQYLFILSTGVIYWLPYTVISASADFRYSNLTVFCSIIMLPILLRDIFYHHKRTFLEKKKL
jgi:hypothetical protein